MKSKVRNILLTAMALFLMIANVQAYEKNIDFSVRSLTDSVNSGELANFIVDFKTTGSTQEFEDIKLEIELPELYEIDTQLGAMEIAGVTPTLDGRVLKYELGNISSGISQRVVIGVKTRNGMELNDDVIVLRTKLVTDGYVQHDKSQVKINASGGVNVAKNVKDIDGDGATVAAKAGSEITWDLRVSSNKKENGQLFIKEDSRIALVDKLDKNLVYKSSTHGGKYNPQNHSVVWHFDAPSYQEQDLQEEYLFVETVQVVTEVKEQEKAEYNFVITNNAEAELTLIDDKVMSNKTSATVHAAEGVTVEVPNGTSYYRGNLRGPSDGNYNTASSSAPNPYITATTKDGLRFLNNFYIHPGVGTSFYQGNKKIPVDSYETTEILESIISNGYQYVDFNYTITGGISLDKLTFGRPSLYYKTNVPREDMPAYMMPIGKLTLHTNKGRAIEHIVDYPKYEGRHPDLNVQALMEPDENVVRIHWRLEPSKGNDYIDGRMSIGNMFGFYFRVKEGYVGSAHLEYDFIYRIKGSNVTYKVDGDTPQSPIGKRSVNIVKPPAGTLPIAESTISLDKHVAGVIQPGPNKVNIEFRNVDGSLDQLTGDYEVYFKLPKNIVIEGDVTSSLEAYKTGEIELIDEKEEYNIYKYHVNVPMGGLRPSEELEMSFPVTINPSKNALVDLEVYIQSLSKNLLVPEYSTDAPTNTIIAGESDDVITEGLVSGDLTVIKSGSEYNFIVNEGIVTNKEVKGSLDDAYGKFGHSKLGEEVHYRLTLSHTKSKAVKAMRMVDVLPSVGDLGITDNVERGSKFDVRLTAPIELEGSIANKFEVLYSTSSNPSREVLNEISTNNLENPDNVDDAKWVKESDVTDWSEIGSFMIALKDGERWESEDELEVEFTVVTPSELDEDLLNYSKESPGKEDKAAWNSFAVAMRDLQVVEPSRVGLAIVDNLDLPEPLIDKTVEGKKNHEAKLDDEFTYEIKVTLPDKVGRYDVLNIYDKIDDNIEVISVDAGEALYTIEDNYLNVLLEKEMIENADIITIKVKAKFKDGVDKSIDNTAAVVVNKELEVEVEEPAVVTPLIPVINAEKSVDKNEIKAGETIEYTIKVWNTGNTDKDVTIADDLSNLPNYTGDKVMVGNDEYTLDELKEGLVVNVMPNETIEVKFEVTIDKYADGGNYVNIATVDELTPEVPIKVIPRNPVIKAEKTVNKGEVTAGDNVEYTITIWNEGDIDKDVFVKDAFDGLDDFQGDIVYVNGVEHSFSELLEGMHVNVEPDSEVNIVFEVKVDENAIGGVYTNKAEVDEHEPSVPVKVIPLEPIIKAEKLVSNDEILAGDTITYTIKVWNEGNKSKVVNVKDTFDGMPEVHGDKVYVGSNEYTFNDLAQGIDVEVRPNENIEVTFEVMIDSSAEGGVYTNTANVDNLTPNVPIKVTPLIPIIKAEKSVDKDVIKAGEIVTYTIRVWNEGNTNKEVLIKDTLENIPGVGQDVYVNNVKHSIEELIEGIMVDVKPNEEVKVIFEVEFDKYNSGGIYTNVAEVDELTPSVPVEVEPLEPSIKSEKTINKDVIKAGETVTYTIRVWNEGEIEKVVTIKDDMKFIEDVSTVVSESIKIKDSTYTIEELKSGIDVEVDVDEVIEFSFEVKFDKEAVGEFTNIANVDELTPGVPVEVLPNNPMIKAEKFVDKDEIKAGESVEYTIRIWNEGNASKVVKIKDSMESLIDNITFVDEYVLVGEMPYTFSELMNGFEVEVQAGETVDVKFTVEFNEDAEGEYINIANVDELTPEAPITVTPEEPEAPEEPGTEVPEVPETPEEPGIEVPDKPSGERPADPIKPSEDRTEIKEERPKEGNVIQTSDIQKASMLSIGVLGLAVLYLIKRRK